MYRARFQRCCRVRLSVQFCMGRLLKKEEGALPVQWKADDGTVIAIGTSGDVRLHATGTRRGSVNVTDGPDCRPV